MGKLISTTVAGVEGVGFSQKAARADAERKLAAKLAQYARMEKEGFEPRVYHWRGTTMLAYNTPEGWWYALAEDEQGRKLHTRTTRLGGTFGGCNTHPDFAELDRRVRFHLAQLGWQPEDGCDPPALVLDVKDRAELTDYFAALLRQREDVPQRQRVATLAPALPRQARRKLAFPVT